MHPLLHGPMDRKTPCWGPLPSAGAPRASDPQQARQEGAVCANCPFRKGKMWPNPFSCRREGRGSQWQPTAWVGLTGMHLPFRLGAVCGCVCATRAPEVSGFETPAGGPRAPPPAPLRRSLPNCVVAPLIFSVFFRECLPIVLTKFCDHSQWPHGCLLEQVLVQGTRLCGDPPPVLQAVLRGAFYFHPASNPAACPCAIPGWLPVGMLPGTWRLPPEQSHGRATLQN